MAYAERKLISNKRSSGGNEGEGVQSYTATVLHAAKSLGKGLRELGETVASSLTGNPQFKAGSSPGNTLIIGNNGTDVLQKGVVTVLDIENRATDDKTLLTDGVIAHFAAHTEAIVCLAFDPSGLLLLTADKRGHDFHLFRIHPHPGGPALAAVHHLYILHRGDTTARVQDMCFSPDSRWVGVSTLRGTTHVFPITPYGGNVGVRTHATPHVVNRMSRFHRSAGLPVEGRSNSPISLFEAPVNTNIPFNNPRLPPYPHPTVVHPLAQIRQPLFIPPGGNLPQRSHAGRPRLNSSSEDNIQIAIRLCCCFAPARAWFDNTGNSHDTVTTKKQIKPVESLFIMSCHGTLLQYDLDPHHITSVPKEKVCDETPIELAVQAKAQWVLQRQLHLNDVPLPITPENLNLLPQDLPAYKTTPSNHSDDRWLSQVEIVTHAGPHRRLWMGPQFTFKTYTANGSPLSLSEVQGVDVNRSKPVNMPVSTAYPILIESGSTSSCEQSPKLLDTYQRLSEEVGGAGELQLKEDLADAMLESPGVRETGGRCVIVSMKPHTASVAKVVNPLGTVVTIHSDDDPVVEDVEDAVIHENCDEALFRRVVAPKSHLFNETKTLHANKSISNKCMLENKDSDKQTKKMSLSCLKAKVETDLNKIPVKNNRLEHKNASQNEVKVEKTVDVIITQKKKSKSKLRDRSCEKEKVVESNTKHNLDPILHNGDSQGMPDLKTLISTPDLVDSVTTFNFPIPIKPKLYDDSNEHEKFTFSPIFNKSDSVKEEKFEDVKSENAEVSTDVMDLQKENKIPKTGKQNREIEEVTLSSEEEKSSTKKVRKPKAKLGVRLSKSKELEKEVEAFADITVPAKKSWSSIVSSKPAELELPPPILDLPTSEKIEEVAQEDLPKKSYSTAAKQLLFEIDPNEDMCNSDVLQPERVYKDTEDPKQESKSDENSSQNEATESDDSISKVVAMDTEEDSCQPVIMKDTSASDKSIKKKSKKKKR
ncbi:breast carcinoma-amplified sequence 3 homolog [Photinus pyralis]|nr:breast carcinoma-amplified sequence 3 homolog [Photinus pyralis]